MASPGLSCRSGSLRSRPSGLLLRRDGPRAVLAQLILHRHHRPQAKPPKAARRSPEPQGQRTVERTSWHPTPVATVCCRVIVTGLRRPHRGEAGDVCGLFRRCHAWLARGRENQGLTGTSGAGNSPRKTVWTRPAPGHTQLCRERAASRSSLWRRPVFADASCTDRIASRLKSPRRSTRA